MVSWFKANCWNFSYCKLKFLNDLNDENSIFLRIMIIFWAFLKNLCKIWWLKKLANNTLLKNSDIF